MRDLLDREGRLEVVAPSAVVNPVLLKAKIVCRTSSTPLADSWTADSIYLLQFWAGPVLAHMLARSQR